MCTGSLGNHNYKGSCRPMLFINPLQILYLAFLGTSIFLISMYSSAYQRPTWSAHIYQVYYC
jgi:hypothetical protein